MRHRTKRFTVCVAAASLLATASIAGTAPAFAETGLVELPQVVQGDAPPDPVLAHLEEIARTQTDAEIDQIVNSGMPAELLVDTSGDDWEITAAVVKRAATGRALSQSGPGCSGTSMCLKNTKPYGFVGSGTLKRQFANVNYIAAGDRKGNSLTRSGKGVVLN